MNYEFEHTENSSGFNIPIGAVKLGFTFYSPNIDRWFCPDCGAHGTIETLDYTSAKSRWFGAPLTEDQLEDTMVQYCCGECFQENVYATFVEEETQNKEEKLDEN